MDVAACARAGAAIGAIAYAADPARVASDLAAYRALAPDAPLVAALRPVAPDSDSAENLAAKLRAARDAGVDRADFYHYGLAPLSALDRIREALLLRRAAQGAPRRGARVDAAVEHELAVHGHELEALGEAPRIVVGRHVADGGRVETVMSAAMPGRTRPRSARPRRCAGSEVMWRSTLAG